MHWRISGRRNRRIILIAPLGRPRALLRAAPHHGHDGNQGSFFHTCKDYVQLEKGLEQCTGGPKAKPSRMPSFTFALPTSLAQAPAICSVTGRCLAEEPARVTAASERRIVGGNFHHFSISKQLHSGRSESETNWSKSSAAGLDLTFTLYFQHTFCPQAKAHRLE